MACKGHRRFSGDGTWQRIHTASRASPRRLRGPDLLIGELDSTINRAHQHGINLTRGKEGTVESQEICGSSPLTTRSAAPAAGRARKINHVCDGNGRPLGLLLGPGQGSGSPLRLQIIELIAAPANSVRRNRHRPGHHRHTAPAQLTDPWPSQSRRCS